MKKILILGGTKFAGKSLTKRLSTSSLFNIFLANRGITSKSDIIINRDSEFSCAKLNDYIFDLVIDFSCYNKYQFLNTYKHLHFDKYIFISSSAVESIPFRNIDPSMTEIISYAYAKKECEEFIINNINKYLIFRPCYIVGEGDYTDRFYKKDNKYYWKDNNLELTYYIEADTLSSLIEKVMFTKDNEIINPCKFV